MLDLSENRWKFRTNETPKYSGFMPNIEKFDAEFFGLPHIGVESMNPQGRYLLEHAYEAILDAGMC
jgi:acyl transferase domain-containing protein